MHAKHLRIVLPGLASLLLSCQSGGGPSAVTVDAPAAGPVAIVQTALPPSTATCENHFVEHTLPFATGTRMREIRTYESNGAGLAINDLDGDGDLDLVFASVDREAAILWNEDNLSFTAEPLPAQFTRAVNTVDVDSDGRLDIVFSHRGLKPPSYWRNEGDLARPRFVETPLPGVTAYAYSMAWGDLNRDGALDLVTGSYNVDLQQQGIEKPATEPNAGIHYYEKTSAGYASQRLAAQSEALAIGLVDLNGDHQLDIWVANDFVLQDQVWLRGGGPMGEAGSNANQPSWLVATPFDQTSHSTMSIDWGDIANNNSLALLTTDMNSHDISVETTAAWLPVIARLEQTRGPGDPQIMANVLQVRTGDGAWRNQAANRGIDATGWSWAGKFGDLDNDGFLDLYVVNGMIAQNLFAHLPYGELVEANHAFRNQGDGAFEPAPQWQLGSTASGRGMSMGDLDNDGDLDIVVNNLRGSAQLFENRLCGGASLQVDLRWANTPNTYAIGARLHLHTDQGVYQRDVRASSGYLSGDPARVHFGLPADANITMLEILWPDGAVSRLDRLAPNTRIEVTR